MHLLKRFALLAIVISRVSVLGCAFSPASDVVRADANAGSLEERCADLAQLRLEGTEIELAAMQIADATITGTPPASVPGFPAMRRADMSGLPAFVGSPRSAAASSI